MRHNTAAVIDGRLAHFSVSQIKDYLRCPRLWAGSKVFHLDRGAQSDGQRLGGAYHSEMEAWYRGGPPPTHPAFAAAPLPAPDPRLLIEHDLSGLFSVGGVPFVGHADLIDPEGPTVYDWKFSKSFRYVQNPATDLQMLCYARWAMEYWNTNSCGVALWYFSGDRNRRSTAHVTRNEADALWNTVVVPAVDSMVRTLESRPLTFNAAPANFGTDYESCRQYGGCAYSARCGREKRLEAYAR